MTIFRSLRGIGVLLTATLALISGAGILSGCGGSGASGEGITQGGVNAGRGRVEVYLANPTPLGQNYTAVNLTITRVEANMDGDWQPISTTPIVVDLMNLPRDGTLIGANTVPTGLCRQVRFFVQDATVTDATGVHPLAVPGVGQDGISADVNYAIESDTDIRLLLDIDAYLSVTLAPTGEYRLQPLTPGRAAVIRTAPAGQ